MWVSVKPTMSTPAINQNSLEFNKSSRNKSKHSFQVPERVAKQSQGAIYLREPAAKPVEESKLEIQGISQASQYYHAKDVPSITLPEHHLLGGRKQLSQKTDEIQQNNAPEKADSESIIYSHHELLFQLKRRYLFFVQKNRKGLQYDEGSYSLMDLSQYPNIQYFLNKVFSTKRQTARSTKLYTSVIGDLKTLLNKYITEQLQIISQEDRENYQTIADKNKQFIKKKQAKFKGFKSTPFTIEDMYKMDFLSLFLKANRNYKNYYSQHLDNISVIPPRTLQTLFSIEKIELTYLISRYNLIDQQIIRQFPSCLLIDEFILILSLLEIKYKVQNYFNRNKLNVIFTQNSHRIFTKQIDEEDSEELQQQQQQQDCDGLKYRFIEVVFGFVTGKSFDDLTSFRRQQIKEQLAKIPSQTAQSELNGIILNMNYQYNISLRDLYSQFKRIRMDNIVIQPQQIYEEVRKSQWSNIKCKTIPDFFIKRAGKNLLRFNEYVYFGFGDRIKLYFNIAIKRFKTVVKTFYILNQIEEKILGKRNIYIKRFQYSSNYIKKHRQLNAQASKTLQNDDSNQKDSVCTLIVAVFNKKLLYSCFIKRQISYCEYSTILKRSFSKKLTKLANFNLVLDEFRLNKHFLTKEFPRINNYYKRYFDSHVYIMSLPQQFELHMMIDAFMKAYIVQKNNHEDVIKVLEAFEQRNSEQIEEGKTSQRMKTNFVQNMIKIAQQWKLFELDQFESLDEIKNQMKENDLTMADTYKVIRDSARFILVFQAFFQEISYKCDNLGKMIELKTYFGTQVEFLRELFISENKEIDQIFPNERRNILSTFISPQLYKGIKSDVFSIEKHDENDVNKQSNRTIQVNKYSATLQDQKNRLNFIINRSNIQRNFDKIVLKCQKSQKNYESTFDKSTQFSEKWYKNDQIQSETVQLQESKIKILNK